MTDDILRDMRRLIDSYQTEIKSLREENRRLKLKLVEIGCDIHFDRVVPYTRKNEIEELAGVAIP